MLAGCCPSASAPASRSWRRREKDPGHTSYILPYGPTAYRLRPFGEPPWPYCCIICINTKYNTNTYIHNTAQNPVYYRTLAKTQRNIYPWSAQDGSGPSNKHRVLLGSVSTSESGVFHFSPLTSSGWFDARPLHVCAQSYVDDIYVHVSTLGYPLYLERGQIHTGYICCLFVSGGGRYSFSYQNDSFSYQIRTLCTPTYTLYVLHVLHVVLCT